MPNKPASKPARAAVAVLCVFVLVLVWIAAWRVKARKLAGRAGDSEPIEATAGPPPRLKADADPAAFFALHPGEKVEVELPPQAPAGRQRQILDLSLKHGVPVRFVCGDAPLRLSLDRRAVSVEHFTLSHEAGLSVRDRSGRPLVDFLRPVPGEILRWQELELTPVEISPDSLLVDLRLRPGGSCAGAGRYHQVRVGLQVWLPGRRLVTVLRIDDAGPFIQIDDQQAYVTSASSFKLNGVVVESASPGLLITTTP